MKNKWALVSSTLIVAVLILFGVFFFSEKSFVFDKKHVSNYSGKNITLRDISLDVEKDITFIAERLVLKEQEEQERLRLEQERIEQEKERLRLEEEKRKEEERLRLEEEKRKEEERIRLEEEKRQKEERLRLEEEKRKQAQRELEEQRTVEEKENQSDNTIKQPTKIPHDTPNYPGIVAYEKEVVKYTNIERVKNGLPELKIDNKLSEVAWYKSKDMETLGYFDHTSPTYGSPFDMMSDFGVHFTAAGENIAFGFPSAKSVVDGWMNSPGHRANILNEMYTHIGVGYVQDGHYATQMFLRK